MSVNHVATTNPSYPNDISFTGTVVMQLFQDLTPNTVSMIEQFVNDGYYVGKDFTRIANGFPGTTDYVAQGGAPNSDGTGNSGQPERRLRTRSSSSWHSIIITWSPWPMWVGPTRTILNSS